jgi:hypothetical protein
MNWDQVANKFINIAKVSLTSQHQQGIVSAISGLGENGFGPLLAALAVSETYN